MTLLRAIALPILIAAMSVFSFGQMDGNPDNWCRGGLFATESNDFQLAAIKPINGGRAYFYEDGVEKCTNDDSCRAKAYLVPDNKLIISSKWLARFACGWFSPEKGSPTIGWIKLTDIIILPSRPSDGPKPWLGEWRYADNSIKFTENKLAGYLNVTGDAIWKGLGDNVHIGELDDRAEPRGGILKYGEADTSEFACKATMRLLGGFLIVADNMNCGGVNVTFSGVYRKVFAKIAVKTSR